MSPSPPSKVTSLSATEELISVLGNPNVHYSTNKGPPLVTIPYDSIIRV